MLLSPAWDRVCARVRMSGLAGSAEAWADKAPRCGVKIPQKMASGFLLDGGCVLEITGARGRKLKEHILWVIPRGTDRHLSKYY